MDYKEAIRRVKAWRLDADDMEVLSVLIPELKENADERIRSCIELALTDVNEQRFTDFGVTLKDCLAYLKKQKGQKPAGWSEEDLQHKSWILECLADGEKKMPEYAEDFQAAYKWLKSLRHKPHWKPSEEQMEALKNIAYGSYQIGDGPVLRELYDNLKKL